MSTYRIRFWFEHGGICLWGMNEATKEKYGYAIENNELPLSETLIEVLNDLEIQYSKSLNWESPLDMAPWTKADREKFREGTNVAYSLLVEALGSDFEVINDIEDCIYEKD